MNSDETRIRRVKSRVLSVMRQVRATTPQHPTDSRTAKSSEIWQGYLDGKPIQRVIIYLRSSGCSWAMGRSSQGMPVFKAGCLDCAHSVVETTFGRPVSADEYVEQFLGEYRKYDFSKYTMLCIYNEGSFYNSAELPVDARREILKIVSANRDIRAVVLESLPEFISDGVLEETRRLLGD